MGVGLGNLINLGPAVMLGSPSQSWLSDLCGVVQMSLLQCVNCDSFCSSSNVKLECLGAMLNYLEGTLIRPLTCSLVGIPSDEHTLSLLKVVWQCLSTGSMLEVRTAPIAYA